MWSQVSEAGGSAARDNLWSHPDLLPSSEEIDQPSLLLKRLGLLGSDATTDKQGGTEVGSTATDTVDDFDRAIAELLDSDAVRPIEGEFGDIVSDPSAGEGGSKTPDSEREAESGETESSETENPSDESGDDTKPV